MVLSRSFLQQPPFESQRPPRLRTTSGRPPWRGPRWRGLVLRRFSSRSAALLTLSHVRPFGYAAVPTMASADCWLPLPPSCNVGSLAAGQPALPGYCALTFTLMSVGSTTRRSVQVSGFAVNRLLTPPRCLYPLRVPRTSVLPSASFRSPVTRGTLAVQLTLPPVGRVKDFHLQVSVPARHTTVAAGPRRPTRLTPGCRTHEVLSGGEGGIRTHVPELPDHPISSRRRYDHFGTSPIDLMSD